jgi:uncharacterized repeat protein (TIGR03943 family)
MSLPPRRAARALALVLWAAFFDWLWLSGEWVRFVGPRTAWIVPFGALLLTLVALAYLATSRRGVSDPTLPSAREVGGLLALVAPVIALFVVPGANLGSLAVARKGERTAPPPPPASRHAPPTLFDVSYASKDAVFARQRGIVPGRAVRLTGLVSDSGRGGFDLARFVTTCCAADAVPYRIRVVLARAGAAQPRDDRWVEVAGRLDRPASGEFRVRADQVRNVRKPDNPYG